VSHCVIDAMLRVWHLKSEAELLTLRGRPSALDEMAVRYRQWAAMSEEEVQRQRSGERTALTAFSRALACEAHVLNRRPDRLRQQICDRPRMENMSLIEEHLR